MRKIAISMVMIISLIVLVGCTEQQPNTGQQGDTTVPKVSHEDGTYRGAFLDGGAMQVGIQMKLENNIVKEATFRHLEYRDVDYKKEETDETVIALRGQYEELLNYLVNKDIRDNLKDLYEPGNFVEDVDTFTGATIRSSKVISAIRDALNRGVYSY